MEKQRTVERATEIVIFAMMDAFNMSKEEVLYKVMTNDEVAAVFYNKVKFALYA